MSTPPLWFDTRGEWLRAQWERHRSLYHPEADERLGWLIREALIEECGPVNDHLPARSFAPCEVASGDEPEVEPELMPWEAIGAELGVSKERARQIAEKALRKLRHVSRSYAIAEFLR